MTLRPWPCRQRVYEMVCEVGWRCVIYQALAICSPVGQEPDKWYILLRAEQTASQEKTLGPYDSAEEAEHAARAIHEPGGACPPHRADGEEVASPGRTVTHRGLWPGDRADGHAEKGGTA